MKVLILLFLVLALADHERVAMKDISVVHFANGKMTKGRRSSPVPQMECVGGACHRANDVMRTAVCKNIGWDGEGVIWQCEAALPNGYDLGETTVSCEGWDGAGDPYVLAGSCQLEYELKQNLNHEHEKTFSEYVRKEIREKILSGRETEREIRGIVNSNSDNPTKIFISIFLTVGGLFLSMIVIIVCMNSENKTVRREVVREPRRTTQTTRTEFPPSRSPSPTRERGRRSRRSPTTSTHTTETVYVQPQHRNNPVGDAITYAAVSSILRPRTTTVEHHHHPAPASASSGSSWSGSGSSSNSVSSSSGGGGSSSSNGTHTSTSYAKSKSR